MIPSTAPTTELPDNEYTDVTEMLCALAELAIGSSAYDLQRDHIVRRCLPLADNLARRYRGRGESLEDLQQVARVGLVKAVTRFDPTIGAAFLPYAVPTILGEVRRHFRDHGWSVRVPRRLKDLYTQINAVSPYLAQQLHRSPTATELAEELGVDREEVVEAQIAGDGYAARSIDAPAFADDGPGGTMVGDLFGTFDHKLAHVENRESLRPLIQGLADRERAILAMRFFDGMTQTQIAAEIGVSQMQVSRLLAKTLAYLRRQLVNA